MSEDLRNEVEAINSIYGDETIQLASDNFSSDVYILSIPQHQVSLRLSISFNYPEIPILILGTETTGDNSKKGYGSHVLDVAKESLQAVFTPGSVCLFDLLQELDNTLAIEEKPTEDDGPASANVAPQDRVTQQLASNGPQWTLSSPVTEKKSIFLARACAVTSAAQAKAYVAHLLSTDKRAAKATHNITAYRLRSPSSTLHTAGITFQDCDDDGETAAGGRLLHLLQVMNVWDVLVVVSRWYGGVKLGPDRFRLINTVAREAVVTGGWKEAKSK